MKTKTAIIAAVSILIAVCTGIAQNAQCVSQGAMCQMTPEQKAARQQQMTATMEQLRQKQAAGTITEAEKLWLARMEQRGGLCVNGTPRNGCGLGQRNGTGPRAQAGLCPGAGAKSPAAQSCQMNGKGRGMGAGQGCGSGMGLKNGTGPRSLNGTCPMQNTAPAN